MNAMTDGIIAGDQGLLFWLACGAVALGMTMLVTAAVVQARRLGARGKAPAEPVTETESRESTPGKAAQVNREPIRAIRATESTRRTRPRNRQQGDTDRLVVLLSRLENISDRLETVAGSVAEPAQVENPQTPAESPLKEQSGAVEYVFRAAGG